MRNSDTLVAVAVPASTPFRARRVSVAPAIAAALMLTGCASVGLQEAGTLSTYNNLGKEDDMMGKVRSYADKDALGKVKTVRIMPTAFSATAAGHIKEQKDRQLVATALDRAVCVALSDKYAVVAATEPADLTIRSVVTEITPTDKAAAGISTVATLGSSFVIPVGVPRLPIGLGGLALEGEATDAAGAQRAAILWAKGANSITNKPRVSDVGDAYELSAAYGEDFAKLLTTGEVPALINVSMPTGDRISSFFGGKPKYAACDAFGRAPGVPGLVAGVVGAPPDWTDKGATGK